MASSPYNFTPVGTGGDCDPCECQSGECLIFEDDFDRANADDPGSDWDERSGDADIASNQLLFASTGLLKLDVPHPDGVTGKQTISFDFVLDSTSSYARGIVGMADDSNFVYASVEQSGGCWVLRLADDADTPLQNDVPLAPGFDVTGTHTLRVCFDPVENILSAILNTSSVGTFGTKATGVTASGEFVGLAGTTDVVFDDFTFHKLYDATHTNCPECATGCFIGDDEFNRSDSTNIGCQWSELTGDFSISTNRLRKGTAAGIALYLVFHPDLDLNHYVIVDITLPSQSGMTVQNNARVYVNVGDSSNYHYGQLKLNEAGDELQIAVGKNGTTLASEVLAITPSASAETYHMTVCWDDDNQIVTAYVQMPAATLGVSAASTRVGDGIYVGLGGDSSDGEEYFDNFEFWKHTSEEEPGCQNCPEFDTEVTECDCCDEASQPPALLTVDLGAGGWTDIGNCAGCPDVSGEFGLAAAGCEWWYCGDPICPNTCCVGNPDFGLVIKAFIERVSDTHCKWVVTVSMRDCGGGCTCTRDPADSCDQDEATYESSEFADEADCTTVSLTLTKVSEDNQGCGGGDPLCGGSLPNTITLAG